MLLTYVYCLVCLIFAIQPIVHMKRLPQSNEWDFVPVLKNFAVFAPKTFRPGQPYSVAVNLISGTRLISLERINAGLTCISGRINYEGFTLSAEWSKQTAGEPQKTAVLTMELAKPPARIDYSAQCKLRVTLTDTADMEYSATDDVSISPISTEVFIQTDKAIYSPGQLVKFRVVTVSESLKPVFENVTAYVKDAEGNLVDKFEHRPAQGTANLAEAVLTGEFRLSDQPNLGDWSIVAETSSGKETKVFTVDRYVLPKFELRIQLPEFVHINDTEFSVTAEPRYTYDKTAEGDLTVVAFIQHSCLTGGSFHGAYSNCNISLTGRQVKRPPASGVASPAVGPVEFKFSMGEWRDQLKSRGFTMPYWTGVTALVAAEFKEKFSGVKSQVKKTFPIYKELFSLQVDVSGVDFIVPGMTVPVLLKLVRPDGQPYSGALPSGDVTLHATWYVRGISKSKLVFSAKSGGTGKAASSWVVSFPVPEDADYTSISFEAACPGLASKSYANLRAFQTRGSSAVRLEAQQATADGPLTVRVFRGTGIHSRLFCAVVNQEGALVNWLPMAFASSAEAADSVSGSAQLTAHQVAALAPKFTLLAVGFHGNELIAASLTYMLPGAYDGVRLTSNVTGAASPQQAVNIGISAGPDSIVFLTGIDHSVNLMKTGQDISASVLEQRAAASAAAGANGIGQPRSSWWHPSPTTGSELKKAGLLALTDFSYVRDQEPVMFAMRANLEMDEGIAMAASAPMAKAALPERSSADRMAPARGGTAAAEKKPLTVRKFFPESFVWTWLRTDSNGTANHAVSLPDTVTSWDVAGFALRSGAPLQGTRNPLNIVSRQAFFLRPVLPYALIRGEKFLLKVLVFNYGSSDVAVRIGLRSDPSFRLLADSQSGGFNRSVARVPAGGSGLAVFNIEPVQLPEMKLYLSAEAVDSADAVVGTDAVERQVRVDAEGAVQRKVASILLNLTALGSAERHAFLSVDFPAAGAWMDGKMLVDGSEYARIQVTGTVLGASVANLERLLRMPFGCGEQNMINFAPAVFVLDCLGPTEATPDIVAKAVGIMKTGYQRELTYRRHDGSYSAFGNSDPAGSTWLTAFVLSVYAQASGFIAMDPEALSGKSLAYLLSKQRPDGSFAEAGRVIHADMQGAGASGASGLTAYVCASLIRIVRACHNRPDLRSATYSAAGALSALRRGLGFVKSNYQAKPADFRPSDLAVAAYAARLAVLESEAIGDPMEATDAKVASFLWMQLYEASLPDGDTRRYWPGTSAASSASGSAETTGYALMTALLRGSLETATEALRWLSAKQGDLGGFQSTQDTVVGLQAMARFAKAYPAGDGVGSVTLTWPGQLVPLRFGLGPSNRTLLQSRELGRGPAARALSGVSVSGSGSGVAMVTVAYAYNLRDAPRGWLTADWTHRSGLALKLAGGAGRVFGLDEFAGSAGMTVQLSVCAKAGGGGDGGGSPGMHLISLTNPSGFGVEAHSPIGGTVSRVEAGPESVVFYLSELSEEEICLSVRWIREIPVLDLNPQRITVQNYYQPDRENSLFFLHEDLKGLTECQVCPDCPKCRSKGPNAEL